MSKQEATRLAFDRWCQDNGHGTLDDMVSPLDRSLRALMWSAWQAARRWPDGEPVAFALRFEPDKHAPRFAPDKRLNLSTVFDTLEEAQDYASRCTGSIEVVPLYTAPPAESERIAERKWLDNECLDGGCQSLKWHERIAALERKGAESKRPTVAIGAKASEWKTLSPQAQALIQQAAQKAVDRWSEQQKLDGAARAATPLVPLGASDLDRAHGGIDDRIAALEAENAEWKAKAATWLASPEAASRLQGYRELTERIAALEAALEQARVALRHGIKTINHLGGAVECMPLHEALRAIEEAQHG